MKISLLFVLIVMFLGLGNTNIFATESINLETIDDKKLEASIDDIGNYTPTKLLVDGVIENNLIKVRTALLIFADPNRKFTLRNSCSDVEFPNEIAIRTTVNHVTPLIYASYHGYVDIVSTLLKYADYTLGINGLYEAGLVTPIFFASSEGHLDIVKMFLSKTDISVNDVDGENNTILIYAAANGHYELVDYLITTYPDINLNHKGRSGYTALLFAMYNGQEKVIERLLQKPNIDPYVKNQFECGLIEIGLINYDKDPGRYNKAVKTVLNSEYKVFPKNVLELAEMKFDSKIVYSKAEEVNKFKSAMIKFEIKINKAGHNIFGYMVPSHHGTNTEKELKKIKDLNKLLESQNISKVEVKYFFDEGWDGHFDYRKYWIKIFQNETETNFDLVMDFSEKISLPTPFDLSCLKL